MVSPSICTRGSEFQPTALTRLCIPSDTFSCSLLSQMCALRESIPRPDSQLPTKEGSIAIFLWLICCSEQSCCRLCEQSSLSRLQLHTPCCWHSPSASVTTSGAPSSALSSRTTHPAHQRPWQPQKAAALEGASSSWLRLPEGPYFHLYRLALLSASAHGAASWMNCKPLQAW